MARPLRIQYPGAVYHGMNRGGSRQKVSVDKQDYEAFLKTMVKFAIVSCLAIKRIWIFRSAGHLIRVGIGEFLGETLSSSACCVDRVQLSKQLV
jgi:hypothetical protein